MKYSDSGRSLPIKTFDTRNIAERALRQIMPAALQSKISLNSVARRNRIDIQRPHATSTTLLASQEEGKSEGPLSAESTKINHLTRNTMITTSRSQLPSRSATEKIGFTRPAKLTSLRPISCLKKISEITSSGLLNSWRHRSMRRRVRSKLYQRKNSDST